MRGKKLDKGTREKAAQSLLESLFGKKKRATTQSAEKGDKKTGFFHLRHKALEGKVRSLEERTEKKFDRVDESFQLMKNMLEELRKENDELRRDRQYLLDKLKTIIIEKEYQKRDYEKIEKAYESRQAPEPKEKSYVAAAEEPVHEEKQQQGDKNIETPLDSLLELVMKKGKVKFSEAAKFFHVKENKIDEWARILEEHDLVEVHYPAVGNPVIKKK